MQTLFNLIYFAVLFAPENEGGTGGNSADGETPADPGTVLFPNEKKPDGDEPGDGDKGSDDGKTGDDGKPADADKKPAEWKEYVPDPKKSDEENAAAKAEHDKTKPKEGDEKKKDGDKADQVPADGKYELKMPEGIEVDTALLEKLSPVFKELELTNGKAQKLADVYTEVRQAEVKKQSEDWSKTISDWADDAKADKEIGGDKWDATVAASTRAVNKLGTPALKEYLNASGGGNHPELIRFMSKVGAMIREDDPASGDVSGSAKPAEPAHVLFPSDAPKG